MRRLLLVWILALTGPSVAAQAQLPPVPEPPVTTPTLPLPLPPLPPLPAPPPAPAPAPPTTPPLPLAPAPATAPAPQQPSADTPAAGSEGGGGGRASREEARPRRQRTVTVTFTFRVPAGGLVRIPLTQVAPVCRDAGRLLVRADRGRNRFRFDGRAGRRPLPDGTYVAETPSASVRFAIVRGQPTKDRDELDPSVCPPPAPLSDGLRSAVAPGSAPQASEDGGRGGGDDDAGGVRELPRVLGTSLSEAAEAAASLHPAFYVLLALAIAALAVASLPARSLPVAPAGAVLARRRAELTLAGTLGLLTVIVAYWVALA